MGFGNETAVELRRCQLWERGRAGLSSLTQRPRDDGISPPAPRGTLVYTAVMGSYHQDYNYRVREGSDNVTDKLFQEYQPEALLSSGIESNRPAFKFLSAVQLP